MAGTHMLLFSSVILIIIAIGISEGEEQVVKNEGETTASNGNRTSEIIGNRTTAVSKNITRKLRFDHIKKSLWDRASNFIDGKRQDGDEMLHSEEIIVSGKRRMVVSIKRSFYIPKTGSLTLITVLNEGTPGTISGLSGGVEENRIAFTLFSRRGQGIRYNFTVYGYKNIG
uniref:Jacalin-type lectin domain-containing protein n=1 Tax=Clastoptera arizonana TaxID=38151 RepID=A0A1B6CNN2_9HEMI